MHKSILREQIIGAYGDTMKDYYESADVKYATWEWNKWYFSFREKLDPDLRQEFDELIRADEESCEAAAEEALYRGVMIGIAEREILFQK